MGHPKVPPRRQPGWGQEDGITMLLDDLLVKLHHLRGAYGGNLPVVVAASNLRWIPYDTSPVEDVCVRGMSHLGSDDGDGYMGWEPVAHLMMGTPSRYWRAEGEAPPP